MVHLACAGRYGFFRDELYFIACGARPAWGYVDQPPLTPLLAHGIDRLVGGSLLGFRLLPALGAGLLALVTGRLARQLGAGAFGEALAALAVSIGPVFLVTSHLFTVNMLEPGLWTLLVCLTLEQLDGPSARRWLGIGALVGLGLLNKYSIGFWVVSLLIGLAVTPDRRVLGSRGLLAGAALASGMVLPNVLWQLEHGLPFLALLRAGQAGKNVILPPLEFAQELVLQAHPFTLPLVLAGAAGLWQRRRPVAVAVAVFLTAKIVLRAKPYYAAPAFPTLLGAGAAFLERALSTPLRRGAAVAVLVLGGAATAPLAVPLLDVEHLLAYQRALGIEPPRLENKEYGELPQHLADQFGWPEIGAAMADAFRAIPAPERARAAVFTFNYGDAAAGARFGHVPTISGHNQYGEWGPAPADGSVILVFGASAEEVGRFYARVERIGTGPSSPLMMPYERARPIWLAREPRRPLAEVWPALRHVD
jgi:hypothetical protein